jgi:DNA-binding response OmpR family regulator
LAFAPSPSAKLQAIFIKNSDMHLKITLLQKTSTQQQGGELMNKEKKIYVALVILDIMMPGTNGFAICKELRKASKIPIVLLTARASGLDYDTGFDLGCNEYITKPFSTMELVSRIDSIFSRQEADANGGV